MSCNACMIWMGWKHSYLSFLWAFNSKSQISGSIPRVSSLIAKNCIYFPVIGLNHIQCRKTIKINKKNASADGVYHPCLVKFCKVRRLLHPRKKTAYYNSVQPRSTTIHLLNHTAKRQGTHLQMCLVLFGHLPKPVRILWAFLVLRHIFQPVQPGSLGSETAEVGSPHLVKKSGHLDTAGNDSSQLEKDIWVPVHIAIKIKWVSCDFFEVATLIIRSFGFLGVDMIKPGRWPQLKKNTPLPSIQLMLNICDEGQELLERQPDLFNQTFLDVRALRQALVHQIVP